MGKIKGRHIIFTSILIALIIIVINTTIVVTKRHEELLIKSLEDNIKYHAKRCFLEEKCSDSTTLQTLIDNGYITEVVHPVTKEVIDTNLKIDFIDNQVTISWGI